MNHKEIRKKFFDFFEKNDHKKCNPAPLVSSDDPSVLFTTAGMQQFKKYYSEPDSAPYKNMVTIQPCLRTSDIDEVGDASHNTFFEMLGNFSFDGYFKETAIKLAYDFLINILKIDKDKLYVSIFPGDKEIPLDQESIQIARKLGIADAKIKMGDRNDNFWGPVGESGPCGPTLEFYFKDKNIDLEIWNIVFNEYTKDVKGKYTLLKNKGIDTGVGFERLAQIMQNKQNIYETDLLSPIYQELEKLELSSKEKRILTDHMRASVFLANERVSPSNKEQGYILRRLIRKIYTYLYINNIEITVIRILVDRVVGIYKDIYPSLMKNKDNILSVVTEELNKFSKTISSGLIHLEQAITNDKLNSKNVFKLYESYGVPIELTKEIAGKKNIKIDSKQIDELFKKHQQTSRSNIKNKFHGGLTEINPQTIKLHSVHHLLLAGLRMYLGGEVVQRGSNITSERLRIDFNYHEKIDGGTLKKIEDWVNSAIKKGLVVDKKNMTPDEAFNKGALGEFQVKYPAEISVYTFLDRDDGVIYSMEICGGPHVKNTKEIGKFHIKKEESSSAGVRRIKGVIE